MESSDQQLQETVLTTSRVTIESHSNEREQTRSVSGLRSFLAGGIGGVVGISFGHPFDTIKVRIQTSPLLKPGEEPLFRGTVDCLRKTVHNEGVLGLFKGLLTPVAFSTPICAVQFWAVTMGRTWQMSDPHGIPTNFQNFTAGMFSGACGAVLITPCDRIKCLLQVQQNSKGEGKYKGPLDCLKQLYNERGIASLYKGTCATLLRDIPGMGFYFFSYEWILNKITLEGERRENLNPLRYILAGGMTGMICWFSALPADVLKSRVQIAPEGKYPRGARDAFKELVRNEGVPSLYKGLTPVLIRAFVVNGGVFFGYEVSLKLFNWIAPE